MLWLSAYFCLDCFEFAFVCLGFPLRTNASAASRRFRGWHWHLLLFFCFPHLPIGHSGTSSVSGLSIHFGHSGNTQFLVFPFASWFVVLFHSGLRKYIIWFQFWEQYWDFVCYLTWHWLTCYLPWDCMVYIPESCTRRYCLMSKSVASGLRPWLSPDISLLIFCRDNMPIGKSAVTSPPNY